MAASVVRLRARCFNLGAMIDAASNLQKSYPLRLPLARSRYKWWTESLHLMDADGLASHLRAILAPSTHNASSKAVLQGNK